MRNTGGIVRMSFDLEENTIRVEFKDGSAYELSGWRASNPEERTTVNVEGFPDPGTDPEMGLRRIFTFETFIVGGVQTFTEPPEPGREYNYVLSPNIDANDPMADVKRAAWHDAR